MTATRVLIPALLLGGVLLGFRGDPLMQRRNQPRFQVPEGFRVEPVLPTERTGSVVAFTFDSQGRLAYSKERGPVVTVIPQGGEVEERPFAEQLTSCQGLVFDGPDLLAACNGPEGTGLYRAVDADGDARAERVETVTLTTGGIQEHGPHALFYGPDGYLYWTLGNHVGIHPTVAPLSPYRGYREDALAPLDTDPRGHAASIRAPGGTFLRRDPRAPESDWERVAGGFRNQYDGAFNLDGELFTFDSDMEWDLNLPWYRPVRSVHVVPGGEYGWRTGARKWPAHYPDNLPPMTEVGRGSPTGVAFYQHHAFPADYRDAFFQADWSRGRILVGRLARDGATYRQELQDFVLGTPLNVTDVEVGPDGAMYFSLGGRDTEGGIYRVVHRDAAGGAQPQPRDAVEQALALPQPRSAWARERARALREQVGAARWGRALRRAAADPRGGPERRARALELLQWFGPAPDQALLFPLLDDPAWQVRAAAVYHLGLHSSDAARQALAGRLADPDPLVRRRAAEALVRTGIHPAAPVPAGVAEALLARLDDPDRWVRYAARQALQRVNRNRWRAAALAADGYPRATEAMLALVHTSDDTHDVPFLLQRELELLRAAPADADLLGLLRVMQLTMLRDAGVPHTRTYADVGKLLLERFPTGNSALDRELARTLAHLQAPGAIDEILAALEAPGADREQQILYAHLLAELRQGWDQAHAERMAAWYHKVREEEWKGGASFLGFVEGAWNRFLARLPEEGRRLAMERVPSLSPQAGADGEAMPAFRRVSYAETLSDQELEEYLVFDPMSYRGNPGAGAAAFDKAFCSSCHRFGPIGQEFGPDLTTIGQRFRRKDLLQAILYPSHTISDLWAAEEITRRDGKTLVGNVYREDAQTLTLSIAAGPQVTIPKSEIASRRRSATSPMPAGLLNNLTQNEMRDLLLFLEAGPSAIPDSLRAAR